MIFKFQFDQDGGPERKPAKANATSQTIVINYFS